LALVIVVLVLLVGGVIWRARTTRRLTIEQSVDRYRRTLTAVHDASSRSTSTDAEPGSQPRRPEPSPFERASGPVSLGPASRRSLVIAGMAVVTVVAILVVIAASHGKPTHRAAATATTTTAHPRATQPNPTTTQPAATTTVPLVKASRTAANTFTVAKPTYTIVVQTSTGICWVDMRDPSGTALFSGTLAVGQSQQVTASSVTMRLGNPAVIAITVDGTAVPIDLTRGSPLILHFQGSAAPA
jgi:cytoskeletal protein RodZ